MRFSGLSSFWRIIYFLGLIISTLDRRIRSCGTRIPHGIQYCKDPGSFLAHILLSIHQHITHTVAHRHMNRRQASVVMNTSITAQLRIRLHSPLYQYAGDRWQNNKNSDTNGANLNFSADLQIYPFFTRHFSQADFLKSQNSSSRISRETRRDRELYCDAIINTRVSLERSISDFSKVNRKASWISVSRRPNAKTEPFSGNNCMAASIIDYVVQRGQEEI